MDVTKGLYDLIRGLKNGTLREIDVIAQLALSVASLDVQREYLEARISALENGVPYDPEIVKASIPPFPEDLRDL